MTSVLFKTSATAAIIASLILSGLMMAPAHAQVSPSDLSQLIEQLKTRIIELQAQLATRSQTQSSATNPALATAANAVIGDKVVAIANLRVRNFYSVASRVLGTVPVGTVGTVLNAAKDDNGTRWLQIDYSTGLAGWSSSNWLAMQATPENPAIIVTCDEFNFEPNVVNRGETVTMTWETTNADRIVHLSDNQFDENLAALSNSSFPLNGTHEFKPQISSETTLTVYGADPRSRDTCSASVTVLDGFDADVDDIQNITENVAGPDGLAATCDEFRFEPSTIKRGEKTNMIWKTSNVEIASYVAESLDGDVIPGLTNSDFPLNGEYEFYALNTTESILTVFGDSYADNDSCSAVLTVIENVAAAPSCDLFTFTPSNPSRGDMVTMEWKTSNASRVVLEGSINGQVAPAISNSNMPLKGTDTFRVFGSSESTLTVWGERSTTPDVCSASIVYSG